MKTSARGVAAIALHDPLDAILRSANRHDSLERRFARQLDQRGPAECWPWRGAVTKHGYGRMTAGRGTNLKAPRVAYALATGVSPGAWMVCHTCDNPSCCNLGKAKDNVRDAVLKGRAAKPPCHIGDRHPRAQITGAIVAAIRASNQPSSVLARRFGVSHRHINRVRSRETWSHAS